MGRSSTNMNGTPRNGCGRGRAFLTFAVTQFTHLDIEEAGWGRSGPTQQTGPVSA